MIRWKVELVYLAVLVLTAVAGTGTGGLFGFHWD